MPIYTYGVKEPENTDEAMAILSLAENLYVTGDTAGALENYIQAADLLPSFDNRHVIYAALAAEENKDNRLLGFEALRISATFFNMVTSSDGAYKKSQTSMYRHHTEIKKIWKQANLLLQPHIIFPGEGGMICLAELVWNEHGTPSAYFTQRPEMIQRIREFLKPRLMYGFGISTFCDDFYDDEDDIPDAYDPVWLITAPVRSDEQVHQWLERWCQRSVRYVSSTMKPVFEAYLAGRGIKHTFPEFEPIEASAEWYTNNCCWLQQGKIKLNKEEQEG